MVEGGCGSSELWNICSEISLDDFFFLFITVITFSLYFVMWISVALLIWIVLWNKFRIYIMPPYPLKLSCRVFGSLWQAFMIICMLMSKTDVIIFHRKQVNAPSDMRLVTFLMDFKCHPCGIK